MIPKPLFDFFLLGGEYYALPFHNARTLAVLGHHVRPLVKNLYESVRFGAFEVKRRKCGMVLLHLILG